VKIDGKPRAERLKEFFTHLGALPAASSIAEARAQLERTLNAVEDEMSGAPYNPALWRIDGRMYPPQDESLRLVPGRPDMIRLRTLAHNIRVRENGAIEISEIQPDGEAVVFAKPGADGRGVTP
jgi:hypothetical protein